MIEKDTDIVSILERLLSKEPQQNLEEIGIVIKVGDGICNVYGLQNASFGEFITFDGGGRGIVLNLDEDYVSIVLLDDQTAVVEQEIAKRTGTVFGNVTRHC